MPLNNKVKSKHILTKEERNKASLKAQEARESYFKLAVKIISWETGSSESMVVKSANKITQKEWSLYKKHFLKINENQDLQKTQAKLNETYQAIVEQKGFE